MDDLNPHDFDPEDAGRYHIIRDPRIPVIGSCLTDGCSGELWLRKARDPKGTWTPAGEAHCVACGAVWSRSEWPELMDRTGLLGPCFKTGCVGRLHADRASAGCSCCQGQHDRNQTQIVCDECGDSMGWAQWCEKIEW